MSTSPRHVVIFINGILTAPGASDGWTDRAVTWTHLHTPNRAEKFEYITGALTRRLFQQKRAEKFARMIGRYQAEGWTVSLVGHSNGCDLIVRILDLLAKPVHAVHLVAAACEASLEANGINDHLEDGTLGSCHIYASSADRALWFARLTAKPLSLFGWGYGSLGGTGPRQIEYEVRERVTITDRPGYGHSTWFADEIEKSPALNATATPFEDTMRLIASNDTFALSPR